MHAVRLLKNGDEYFPAVFDAIGRSARRVCVEMYIVADDATGREFRDRLRETARRGVQVEVLVDAVGSLLLSETFWEPLLDAGGRVRWFHRVKHGTLLFRDHRKLVLVDGAVAYIGGLNIADEYYRGAGGEPPWRDNALEVAGLLDGLQHLFDEMWQRADQPFRELLRKRRQLGGMPAVSGSVLLVPTVPLGRSLTLRRTYLDLVRGAAGSIDLAMGYFYPPGRVLRALRRAVRRGVRVRLLFPARADVAVARWAGRGLYGRLLRAGMEVWEYQPAMLHAKLAVIDDAVVVGSANLDIRSVRFNYELVAVVRDAALAGRARGDFEDDLRQSARVSLEEWKARPVLQRLKERVGTWLLARLDVFLAGRHERNVTKEDGR